MAIDPAKIRMIRESNRDRFVRIAERRVNILLDNLDSLGKCSNRKNYEYFDKDVRQIFNQIEKKVKEIKFLFQETSENKKRFKLEK